MSITPRPFPSDPQPYPLPRKKSPIASAGKAILFALLGMALGVLLAGRQMRAGAQDGAPSGFIAEDPQWAQQESCQRRLETVIQDRDSLQAALRKLAAERSRNEAYATVLLEASGTERLVTGALGWLIGIPGSGEALLGSLPGSEVKWVVPGKIKPLSNAPNAGYAWVNLQTGAHEGPFRAQTQ